jgi:hypothetical protein
VTAAKNSSDNGDSSDSNDGGEVPVEVNVTMVIWKTQGMVVRIKAAPVEPTKRSTATYLFLRHTGAIQ